MGGGRRGSARYGEERGRVKERQEGEGRIGGCGRESKKEVAVAMFIPDIKPLRSCLENQKPKSGYPG